MCRTPSVVGQHFTSAALAAVSGRDIDELEPRLRSLTRKELLAQDADPRSPERGRYGFVQGVIREVAYSTLSKPVRRAKHLAAARFFEGLQDADMSGIVGSHYLEAYRVEPGAPDAEDVAARARTWLVRAAERAQSLGSPEQALTYVRLSLPLATEPAERADLLRLAAQAASFSEDFDASLSYAEDAVVALRAVGDVEGLGSFVAGFVGTYIGPRRSELLVEMLALAEEAMTDRRGAVAARVAAVISEEATMSGQFDRAMVWSERAMTLAEETVDYQALQLAASARASAVFNIGRHWEAALLSRGVVELATQSGSAFEVANAQNRLAVVLTEDDARGALEAFIDAAQTAGNAGIRSMRSLTMANGAESAVDVGAWDVADAMLSETVGLLDTPGGDGLVFTRAMLAAMRGLPDQVAAELGRLGPVEGRWDVTQMQTWYLRVMAVVRLSAGDAAGAVADGLAAVRLDPSGGNAGTAAWVTIQAAAAARDRSALESVLREVTAGRGRWFEAIRETGRAVGLALAGDPVVSVPAAVRALDSWVALDLPLDDALAATAFAWALAPEPLPTEHLTRARATLEGLGAAGLMARLDAATSTTRGPTRS